VKRREFMTLLGGAVGWPVAARAQQSAKMARIGFFRAAGPHEKQFQGFRDGMQALGYVEGQNFTIEQRYAAGVYERLSEYAAELAHLNLDVIVVDGAAAATAAKAATAETPVVFALAADPVADGLVASMSRPGANLTGLTLTVGYQLAGKRVELLKELVPALARVAVLGNSDNPPTQPFLREAERVGVLLGLTVRSFDAKHINDLGHAFAAMADWRADGVTTLNDGMFFSQRERIVALAKNYRLPSVHPEAEFVEAGGLLSYGPSLPDLFRRAASYVVKILKGAKPAELPVEQPSKLELALNLTTGRLLGLTISREFLLRADEVIE
jgi:putative ABC transport system substrate-binding protein